MMKKGVDIVVTIAVCRPGTKEPIGEFDTIREAKKFIKEHGLEADIWYEGAEVIDNDGNTNFPVYGKTVKEVMNKLTNQV